MTFDEVLTQVLDLLQREKRVSYRALKRRFDVDDDYLEDLKDELIYAKKLASDEDDRVLVWIGETASALPPASAPDEASTQERPPPISYTPSYLTEKILTSRTALEGERKQVTVLFADLKGSMELLADRDPEEARQLLDPVLERLMAAVHRYEGTVNQIMGDGIMALFGAPIAHEDHAVRACYAALVMQSAIRAYADQVRQTHQVELQIRVGLNSGEVVVRAIGNDLRMDYSAIGQTTHLAARMEQLATPGSILLTMETLRLVEEVVQVKPLGPTPVRGLRQPLEVFELVDAGSSRTRLQAFAARTLTRFVGRHAEVEAMRQAHARAEAGHGQLVAVIGEPGVGKTRLFYEFLCAPWTQGWLLLESQATSYGQATPYHPVRELLHAYFQLEGRDDEGQRRDKVTGKLGTLDPALAPLLPAVLALLDVPVDDHAWQALDPPQRRQRTLDALKRLVLRESQVQPVLLVCENLHWIDTETQAVLDSLVDSLPTAHLLLLVNYRPEYQHGWGSKTSYAQLRLDPLPAVSADALLQVLLGDDASLEPLKKLLIERTEGNPFFLEESVRTLVETDMFVGEPGAYRLAQELPSIQVPPTVQAVLAARLDRLPQDEKRLVQTAAVIGTEVPFALLQAIAEMSEEALHQGLTHLQAAEFLYETSLFPERVYTFKHALTHEVAYGSLLQERRRALHTQIVTALEALAGDRLTEQVDRLAHHALRGEVWDKALAYCRQVGEKTMAQSAYREAVGAFEQALRALQHLPEGRDTLEQAIDLRLTMRNALLALGDYKAMFDCLREAETLAEAIDDHRRLGRIAAYMTEYFRRVGDTDRAVAAGQHAIALAESVNDVGTQVVANAILGHVYGARGDYRQAIEVLQKVVTALTGDLAREHFGMTGFPFILSCSWLALYLAEVGAFREALVHAEAGLRIAETVNDPFSLVNAYTAIGRVYLRQGGLSQAIPLLERDLALCQSWNIRSWLDNAAGDLGHAYALSGRVAEALPLLEEAASMGSSGQAMWTDHLSEAYLLAGQIAKASTLAEQALALARERKQRGYQAWALRLCGEIASQSDPPKIEPAEAHYQQALALADELGMRPLQAHCHRGLGTLYAATGQREQARTELSTAMELYRVMEMRFWLPETEATLAQMAAS